MGGSGKGAPAPPNFQQAATPSQTNAFGATSQWNQGPNGQYSQQQGFGGPLGGAVQGLESQFQQANASPLDTGAQARNSAENAIYGRETSRLDPRFAQEQSQFDSQMASQGLMPGSEAYNNARGNFDRSKNDAYQQAQYGAITGGGQEASRQQAMDINSRMSPLQGLLGMGQLTGQSQNPLLSAAMAQYQGDLQKYGIQQQGKNSTMGGLAGLGGSLGSAGILAPAIAASDVREKTAIAPTGGFVHGVPEIHFEYKDRPGQKYRGVLAQDVEKVSPGEVFTDDKGRKRVSARFRPEVLKAAEDGDLPNIASQLRIDRLESEAAEEAGIEDA